MNDMKTMNTIEVIISFEDSADSNLSLHKIHQQNPLFQNQIALID